MLGLQTACLPGIRLWCLWHGHGQLTASKPCCSGQYQTASQCLSLQSFAAIIHRHLTLEKASHQGKQALLDLAQQPGMQQVSCKGVQALPRCDS